MGRWTYSVENVPDEVLDWVGKAPEYLTHSELRFLTKIEYVEPEGCWEWTSAVNVPEEGREYGRIRVGERDKRAHRVALNWLGDGVDEDKIVRHRCPRHSTLCVNPDHLATGTLRDNNIDAVKDGNQDRKLTDQHVRSIRWMVPRVSLSQREVAEAFDVSPSMISRILNDECYAWLD